METSIEFSTSPRQEIIEYLVSRDGVLCSFPDCDQDIDLSITDGPMSVSVEHWIPQWYGKENGWTPEEIWAESNLRLAHKKCNAKKGDRVPNEDGTLPPKPESRFKYRRQKRAQRAEVCTVCNAGRNLGPDEECASCGSGPQPHRWPRWAKVSLDECLHDGTFWCWACGSGLRVPNSI